MYPQDTIHNFIQNNVVMEKPKRYVSSSRQNNVTTTVIELQHPANYLTKFSLESKLPDIKSHVRNVFCTSASKKPLVSAGSFLLPAGLPAKRMFTASTKVPKPPLCIVDTNKGHKEFHNKLSGLVPVYIRKKDYGEIPAYLLRRKGKHPKSLEEKSMIEVTKPEEPEIENLTEEECREIIEDLKKKLGKLNTSYQRLPFVIDTPMLKNRKTRLEGEMQQLESDIELLETLVFNK
ncbi:enkurin-like [Hippocampus zosterae]|uniref:enkurin-like n=1 Tax=Hippocampus zosterae TaxID=109293 RepID=UPI00223DE00C|nr:enkurin-like [Hippocampus zosterae]